MYLLLAVFGFLIILITSIVLGASRKGELDKPFEQRNYETLRRYQTQISQLASKSNNPTTDIREALKCSKEIIDCYARLYAFCSQSRDGENWFRSACSFPKSQTERAVIDYTNLLAELQEFHSSFFPIVSPDEKIQSEWAALSCDHDSHEQLTRQKRSIRTLPVYVDHNTRHAYFLSSDTNHIYDVRLFYCTCPDHEKRVLPCKHMYRLFYELTVGTNYTMGVNVTNLNIAAEFSELSDEGKVSYIQTVHTLCTRENRPLTTRKSSYIMEAIQTGLLLQSKDVDYTSLLGARTKDEILISLRKSGITSCYPSWTKVRIIDYVVNNHKKYLLREFKDFTAVTIPPILEPWCKGFCSVIDSRFSVDGDTDFLRNWDHQFEKFL